MNHQPQRQNTCLFIPSVYVRFLFGWEDACVHKPWEDAAKQTFHEDFVAVGRREMSLNVEGSLGMLSFLGILWMRAPFHDPGSFTLIKQVLDKYVSIWVDWGFLSLMVSYVTPSYPLALLSSKVNLCSGWIIIWDNCLNACWPRGRGQRFGRGWLTFGHKVR